MKNNKVVTVLFVLLIIGLVSFAGSYLFSRHPASSEPITSSNARPADGVQTDKVGKEGDNPLLGGSGVTNERGDSTGNWPERVAAILVRLLLAVLLSAALAFRPRKNHPLFQRNLYVAQTQILLAVTAAALMMVVGDNAGRAFAIFAAASLVRFRTNIKDPKEITVLLISLGLGLAAGVGRWELAISLCIFVVALLWLLEFNEPDMVYRPMELTIKTRSTDLTQQALQQVFRKNRIGAEVRQLDPPKDEESIGCIVYHLNLRLSTTTDGLSEQIIDMDPGNIDGIEWKQEKVAAFA
jgi:uncharacterized membrane protein YhiD involved in acid resistance